MILRKGYYSKSHDATLCVLIKHFYKRTFSKEDILLINSVALDAGDILFYVQTKQEREKASYSTKISFEKSRVNDLKLKTVLFVNKARDILKA